MLIKANGAIKSIMNENVKENQSHKSIVCIVYKGRMWVSTALLHF